MRSTVQWFVALVALLALPAVGSGQEATLSGTVTDMTGGVLPGSRSWPCMKRRETCFRPSRTNVERSASPSEPARYQMTAELPGFATVTRPHSICWWRQQAVVNLQMAPSNIQER